MANVLIIFTPRSGSTIVGELLSYKYNAINLDEIIQGAVRGPLRDKLPDEVRNLININKIEKIRQELTESKPDAVKEYSLYQTSFSIIKHCAKKYPVVVKFYPAYMPGRDLVEWAINNNFEIYFMTRRNIEEHLYSFFLAISKFRIIKKLKDENKLPANHKAGFINVKDNARVVFPPYKIPQQIVIENLLNFYSIQNHWSAYLKAYGKYGKLIHYEDYIAKGDFHEIDVTNEMYLKYCEQHESLRPTHEYELGKDIANWSDIYKLAQNFYLPYE